MIGATVTSSCTVNAGGGSDSATINVNSGAVDTTPITKTYPVTCNAPATATLMSVSDGLVNPTAPPSGFANHIDYQAGTTGFVAITGSTTTSGATPNHLLGTDTTGGASNTPVNVQINPQTSAAPLVAGSYSDTLTLASIPRKGESPHKRGGGDPPPRQIPQFNAQQKCE